MFLKGVKNIIKSSMMLFLVICMIVPHEALAVPMEDENVVLQEEHQDTLAEDVEITEVEAVPEVLEEPAALEEPAVEAIAETAVVAVEGTWIRADDGRYRFQYRDGNYATGRWELIRERNGQEDVYCFDDNSWMVTGWQKIDGKWYYLRDAGDGRLATGWQKLGNQWYYLKESGGLGDKGQMLTGLQRIGNSWYYLQPGDHGQMLMGWHKIDGKWYYMQPGDSGHVVTGWQLIYGQWYYLNPDHNAGQIGQMMTGWQNIGGQLYYMQPGDHGQMLSGWQKLGGAWYYFRPGGNGQLVTGWQNLGNKYYYLAPTGEVGILGKMLTGWIDVEGQRYYMHPGDNGDLATGWQKVEGAWYYLAPTGNVGIVGRVATGWQKIGNSWYFLNPNHDINNKLQVGHMVTGWQDIEGQRYYMRPGDHGDMVTGWLNIEGRWYYFRPGDNGQMVTGWQTIDNKRYYFYPTEQAPHKVGEMAASTTIEGQRLDASGAAGDGSGQKTIRGLLQNAIKPVGSTLYIWGGGHPNDRGDMDWCLSGVNPSWKAFYDRQSSSYDYNGFRFTSNNGLDCSGFIGWAVYNTLETRSGVTSTGYRASSTSTVMPSFYAGHGWGKNTAGTSAGVFTPGDIVSKSGHVWIVLGQCSDGSVVLIHATPQAGVQIAGTAIRGNSNTQAVQLAQTYMRRYYPSFVSKFRLSSTTGADYLAPINRFQWDITGAKVMSDPDGYINMGPEQILKDLFGE